MFYSLLRIKTSYGFRRLGMQHDLYVIRAGYRFRCPDSISILDSILDFFLLHSVNSFNTNAIDISKKKMNSKHQFTNGELIKRN